MSGYGLEDGEQENLYFPTNFNRDSKCKFKSRLGRRKQRPEASTHPMIPARSLVLEAQQGEALKDIANILQEPNPALNDSFMSDSSSSVQSDARPGNLSQSFKTPGRSFYLPCVDDSPLDPLKGILESGKEASQTLFYSPAVSAKKNPVHKTLFGNAVDPDRSFGVSSLDDKKSTVPESSNDFICDQSLFSRNRSGSIGSKSSTHPVSRDVTPFKGCYNLNSAPSRSLFTPLLSTDHCHSTKNGHISKEIKNLPEEGNIFGKIKPNNVESRRDSYINSLFAPPVSHINPDQRLKQTSRLFDADRLDANTNPKLVANTPKEEGSKQESLTDTARSLNNSQQPQTRLCKTQDNIPSSLSLFSAKKVEKAPVQPFLKPLPGLELITKNISAHFSKFTSMGNSRESAVGQSGVQLGAQVTSHSLESKSHSNLISNKSSPVYDVKSLKPSVVPDLEKLAITTSNSAAKNSPQPSDLETSLSLHSSSSESQSTKSAESVDEVDFFKAKEKTKQSNSLFQASPLKSKSSPTKDAPNNAPCRSSIFQSSIIKLHSEKEREEPKKCLFPFSNLNHDNHVRGSSLLHNNNNYKVDSILKQDLVGNNRESSLFKSNDKPSNHVSRQPVIVKREDPIFKRPQVERKDDVFKKPSAIFPRVAKQSSNLPDKIYVNNVGYTVRSLLGQGGSSKVYEAEGDDGRSLAIKCVDLNLADQIVASGYLNEINLLARLQRCHSVIRMFNHEYKEEKKKLLVVMEKGDIDFAQVIKSITKTKNISLSMILYYWIEMLQCVHDIHENGVIHSDLKPANFLLVGGRLKLIDFGIASPLQEDMTSVMKDITTGTFNYMSPEAVVNNSETQRGHKLSYKSDVWSLGCILYQLLYGRTPYSHYTNMWTKMQAIADPKCLPVYPSNVEIPKSLQIALKWCLNKNPKKRPTTRELLKMPYCILSRSTFWVADIDSLMHSQIMEMFPHCPVVME